MGSSINPHLIRQKLVNLIHAVSVFLIPLFTYLSSSILRFMRSRVSSNKNNESKETEFQETEPGFFDYVSEKEEEENDDERQETNLKFKFPTFQEFAKSEKGTGNNNNNNNIFKSDVVPLGKTSKYEFTSRKSLVIDEPETFPVNETDFSIKEEPFLEQESLEVFDEIDKGKKVMVSDDGEEKEREILDESKFCSVENHLMNDSDSGSTSFDPDGFLSDGDFIGGFGIEISDENQELAPDGDDENSDITEEGVNDSDNLQNRDGVISDFLSQKDFDEKFSNEEDKATENGVDGSVANDKQESKELSLMSEDGNKLESLWEHQELIEQLKMELKKVRATGLPTILEESESSPKIMEDLKPWKIDERFQHEDCIGEMNKFYKSYREKMRKFDILNYQKMYAMGFLQLKDPLQSMSDQKPSPPSLKSLVSQKLWLFKHKIHGTDPMKKFIKELQGDLEVVYVGQMCLSWEFLHWQYEKTLDLWESDPRGIHRYNEVAGEFQQFQVLVQRFIEDEPFQGPRVRNYVKNRCVLRNLLQVPVIREDSLRDKRKRRDKDMDEYVITSDMLVEIMEESIRIFWRFIRADKDCSSASINSHKKMQQPELQNPEDIKLLEEIGKILQKKERKVKDLLRSENCILKKLRQCREEEDSDQVLYFFSQVDMKLVARVLNMSKINRDQLTWCHNKLSRISFVNRKIFVDPAFLPFPC